MNQHQPRLAGMGSRTRLFIGFAVAVSVLAGTSSANAATPTTKPTVNVSVMFPKLQQAYRFLGTADSNYDGHRDQAMKEIADTCQLLGKKAMPSNSIGNKLHLSDLQIRSVQMDLLEMGRAIPTSDANAPIVAHLNGAISQLATAMASETASSAQPAVVDGENGPAVSGSGVSNSPKGRGAVNAAGTKGAHPIIIDNPIGTNMVEVGALEDIYQTLSFGNHNYAGHRIKAMRAISRVVKILGGSITGDGRGHEEQIVSDQQIHYAQFLLHQVCQSFTTSDPKAVLDDLTTADKEMTTALSVR